MDTTSPPLALAAIVHAGKGSADALLLEFVQELRAKNYRVCGLVQGPEIQKEDHSLRTVQDLNTSAAPNWCPSWSARSMPIW